MGKRNLGGERSLHGRCADALKWDIIVNQSELHLKFQRRDLKALVFQGFQKLSGFKVDFAPASITPRKLFYILRPLALSNAKSSCSQTRELTGS